MHIGFILAASDIFPTALLLPHLDHETGPDTIALSLSYFLVHYLFIYGIHILCGWLLKEDDTIKRPQQELIPKSDQKS